MDRYLADDMRFELFIEEKSDPSIFIPSDGLGMELHRILGAFGCGAFQNKPEVVALAAKNVIKNYLQLFKNIEFAVYCSPNDDRNYKAFERAMKEYIRHS